MTPASRLEALMPWAVTIGLFVVWELGCWAFDVAVIILPRPSVIAIATWNLREAILFNAAYTMATTLIGFALAIAFGLALGVAVGMSRPIYRGLYPVLIGFNSVPKVAVVPILVIWFGIGTVPAILTAFMISFFPIVVNVATGLATIEPELLDVLRALGASRFQILRKVGLPRSMPYFFAALKVAITLAFVGSVLSETVAGNAGIGYLLASASASFNVPLVFAGLVVIAAMGVVMYVICAWAERRFTFWAQRGSDVAM